MLQRFALASLFVATLAAPAFAASDDANLKYFRDLAETRNYTLGRPVSPKITPDGKSVIFLRAAPRQPVLRLYELDLASGRERELLTPAQLLGGAEETLSAEEKARRERQRQSLRGFTAFQLSKDGSQLLVTLSGKLYVVARATLKVTELPGSGWIDPRFSPDGNFIAVVGADREVHLIDPAQNTERKLTTGSTATLSHGTAEFVAQEEMSRNEGYWWSPDSHTLLVQETDEAGVEVRYVADALHPEVEPTKFFYPRAGSPNAVVSLFLIGRDGGARTAVAWDNKTFPYLAHVNWEKSGALTLTVQNREQTDQRLLAVDPTTGAVRELLRETDEAWVNLDDNGAGSLGDRRPPLWLADGKHFLWTSERSGIWQVELRAADGTFVRPLTPGVFTLEGEISAKPRVRIDKKLVTWHYRDLIGVDEGSESILVRGSKDPREIHVWKFPLDDRSDVKAAPLTSQRGIHNATFYPEARLMVRTTDQFDGNYRTEIVSAATGNVVATLPSVAEMPKQLPTTVLGRTSGIREFDVAITRPRNFTVPAAGSAPKKYPVVLQVYAGPGSKTVTANIRGYFTDQWVADQGYIVVRIDGRGTPWHGRDWERAIKGNFIDVALEDQVAGLQELARTYPELDLSRVGVTGWSFGGYFAAMAAARRPDIFRCGVAGAPVVTWENYDTHYTERYLGLPQTSPKAYQVSNVTTYAHQLERPLLLIHGLTDDNVYFQHTLQLADALYMAGKPYELLPMLGTHMIADPLVKLRQQMRILDFLDRSLKITIDEAAKPLPQGKTGE